MKDLDSTELTPKPQQRVSRNTRIAKNYEHTKATMEHYISKCAFDPATKSSNDLNKKYQIYNNIFPEEWFNFVTNPYNSTNDAYKQFPARIRELTIIRPNLDLLMGEYLKRPFNKVVNNYSEDAYNTYLQAKMDMVRSNVTQHFKNFLVAEGMMDEKEAEEALKEIGGIGETELEKEVDFMYRDVMQDFKKKSSAGFIKFEAKREPPVVKAKKVEKILNRSLLPTEIKNKAIYEGQKRVNAFKRVFVYEAALKEHPKFKNEMRLFQDTPYDAVGWGEKNVVSTIGKLSIREYEAFRKTIGLKSLEYELKQGRTVPGNLTLDDIQGALADLEPWKTDLVNEALTRHERFTRMIVMPDGRVMGLAANKQMSDERLQALVESLVEIKAD